jgi:predicted tellurium resistance membrane protein TerC
MSAFIFMWKDFKLFYTASFYILSLRFLFKKQRGLWKEAKSLKNSEEDALFIFDLPNDKNTPLSLVLVQIMTY